MSAPRVGIASDLMEEDFVRMVEKAADMHRTMLNQSSKPVLVRNVPPQVSFLYLAVSGCTNQVISIS